MTQVSAASLCVVIGMAFPSLLTGDCQGKGACVTISPSSFVTLHSNQSSVSLNITCSDASERALRSLTLVKTSQITKAHVDTLLAEAKAVDYEKKLFTCRCVSNWKGRDVICDVKNNRQMIYVMSRSTVEDQGAYYCLASYVFGGFSQDSKNLTIAVTSLVKDHHDHGPSTNSSEDQVGSGMVAGGGVHDRKETIVVAGSVLAAVTAVSVIVGVVVFFTQRIQSDTNVDVEPPVMNTRPPNRPLSHRKEILLMRTHVVIPKETDASEASFTNITSIKDKDTLNGSTITEELQELGKSPKGVFNRDVTVGYVLACDTVRPGPVGRLPVTCDRDLTGESLNSESESESGAGFNSGTVLATQAAAHYDINIVKDVVSKRSESVSSKDLIPSTERNAKAEAEGNFIGEDSLQKADSVMSRDSPAQSMRGGSAHSVWSSDRTLTEKLPTGERTSDLPLNTIENSCFAVNDSPQNASFHSCLAVSHVSLQTAQPADVTDTVYMEEISASDANSTLTKGTKDLNVHRDSATPPQELVTGEGPAGDELITHAGASDLGAERTTKIGHTSRPIKASPSKEGGSHFSRETGEQSISRQSDRATASILRRNTYNEAVMSVPDKPCGSSEHYTHSTGGRTGTKWSNVVGGRRSVPPEEQNNLLINEKRAGIGSRSENSSETDVPSLFISTFTPDFVTALKHSLLTGDSINKDGESSTTLRTTRSDLSGNRSRTLKARAPSATSKEFQNRDSIKSNTKSASDIDLCRSTRSSFPEDATCHTSGTLQRPLSFTDCPSKIVSAADAGESTWMKLSRTSIVESDSEDDAFDTDFRTARRYTRSRNK